tara:strand:+ start:466 stop:591 length:126 start_codon:yes stop_codon:yes gene_type:complete
MTDDNKDAFIAIARRGSTESANAIAVACLGVLAFSVFSPPS